jgi:hypothetical protein
MEENRVQERRIREKIYKRKEYLREKNTREMDTRSGGDSAPDRRKDRQRRTGGVKSRIKHRPTKAGGGGEAPANEKDGREGNARKSCA